MNTIGYFEIQSSNPEREVEFYGKIFGWNFLREYNVPIEYYRIETDSINGGLLSRPAKTPPAEFGSNAFTCSVQVSDFDEMEKIILENGGKIALPKFAIPYRCWQGYFMDLDNNVFGIFEVDENAR
ncbi:MAG: VOC family protein [Bacteroidales bacterium]|nr:VOC family protein [Bacteroidales bacterium]